MATQIQAAKARAAESAAGAETLVERAARELKAQMLDACLKGQIENLQVCLEKGCSVDLTDASGTTALSLATKGGHLACMRVLLKANAQMHSVGGARPALCWAAASGQLEALQLLLASKAKCNERDSFGYTPLLDATKGGHGAVVQCLLSSGADVNSQTKSGASSLSLASERNDLPMVLLLLAALPNLALTTEAGHTAENLARMAGHNEVYRTLAAARTASGSGSSSARSQAGAEGKQP